MLFANNVPSCATATPNNTFSWTSTRLTYPSPRASASAALALHPDERPVFPLDLDGSTRVSRRETCRRCEGGPRAWRCRVGLRYVLSRPDCFKRALWLMSTPRFSSFVLFWQVDDRLMVLSVRLLVVPSRRSPRHRGCAAPKKKASSRSCLTRVSGREATSSRPSQWVLRVFSVSRKFLVRTFKFEND